jgi:hypothetical protein
MSPTSSPTPRIRARRPLSSASPRPGGISRKTTSKARISSASISIRSGPGPRGNTPSPCACSPTRSSPSNTPLCTATPRAVPTLPPATRPPAWESRSPTKTRPAGPDWLSPDLLAHSSVADVRNLLAQTVLHARHDRRHSLRWIAWRLKHKIRAQISHYQRRGDPLPTALRKWVNPPAFIPP